MQSELEKVSKVVGIKQTRRAVSEGLAKKVLIAQDAEAKLTGPIESLCQEKGVPVQWVETMKLLGTACGIDVGAAVVAIL